MEALIRVEQEMLRNFRQHHRALEIRVRRRRELALAKTREAAAKRRQARQAREEANSKRIQAECDEAGLFKWSSNTIERQEKREKDLKTAIALELENALQTVRAIEVENALQVARSIDENEAGPSEPPKMEANVVYISSDSE